MLDTDAVAAVAVSGRRPGADPGPATAAAAAATAAAGAQTKVVSASRSEPKLCPDSSPDKPGARPKDIIYQDYVAMVVNGETLPDGFAVALWNPEANKLVHFDNCRLTDGTMIEAKGAYLHLMTRRGVNKQPWLGAEWDMIGQATRQVQAAGGRPIEWHFAEKPVADYMRIRFAERGFPITVIWTPMP